MLKNCFHNSICVVVHDHSVAALHMWSLQCVRLCLSTENSKLPERKYCGRLLLVSDLNFCCGLESLSFCLLLLIHSLTQTPVLGCLQQPLKT